MQRKTTKKVVVGGTFDVLHKGHEALLRKGLSLGEITIGLTSNKIAESLKKRKVRDFRLRKRDLKIFIKKELSGKYRIVRIKDKFGPTLKEDFDYIVVSPETYKTALLINKKRQKIKKRPIKIVKIKFILGKNGKPIHATEIIKSRMNRLGKSIQKHE